MKPRAVVLVTDGSAANRPDIVALLKSWRDVSAYARGSLVNDLVARGLLTEADASEVAGQTGARL